MDLKAEIRLRGAAAQAAHPVDPPLLLSNYGLARLKKFVLSIPAKLCN